VPEPMFGQGVLVVDDFGVDVVPARGVDVVPEVDGVEVVPEVDGVDAVPAAVPVVALDAAAAPLMPAAMPAVASAPATIVAPTILGMCIGVKPSFSVSGWVLTSIMGADAERTARGGLELAEMLVGAQGGPVTSRRGGHHGRHATGAGRGTRRSARAR
jgi:hypothetical protein